MAYAVIEHLASDPTIIMLPAFFLMWWVLDTLLAPRVNRYQARLDRIVGVERG